MPKFVLKNEVKSYIADFTGSEWITFWNYRSSFKKQYKIFDDIFKLSYYRHFYLVQFCMARNSNSVLRNYTSKQFIDLIACYAEIIKKTQLLSYEPIKQVDWESRESVIAKMRNTVKVVLRKNEYPETGRESVIEGLFVKTEGVQAQ